MYKRQVQIDPLHPLTNPKIVSAIRQELADRLDVESLQLILAEHWTPYLENLHVCMTDATCYESHLRFPTDTDVYKRQGVSILNQCLFYQ